MMPPSRSINAARRASPQGNQSRPGATGAQVKTGGITGLGRSGSGAGARAVAGVGAGIGAGAGMGGRAAAA